MIFYASEGLDGLSALGLVHFIVSLSPFFFLDVFYM
jgi:hypothetical protein